MQGPAQGVAPPSEHTRLVKPSYDDLALGRGQTQFQGAENGRELQEAHSVVPLVLTLSADGKVSGVSADNGCTLLGLWAPGVTPRLFTLDVTLSEGRHAGLNRRCSGTVLTAQIDQWAQFTLMAYTVPIPGNPSGDTTSGRRCGGDVGRAYTHSAQHSQSVNYSGATLVDRVGHRIGFRVLLADPFPVLLPALHQRIGLCWYGLWHR
jgi:hypothetical protein